MVPGPPVRGPPLAQTKPGASKKNCYPHYSASAKNPHLYRQFLYQFILFAIMNTPASPAPDLIAVNEVTAAVEQLRRAMISADGTVLAQLAHDELTYGHSGGQVQNKQAFIASFTSGDSVFVDIEITGQTVRIIGDTALARHTLSASTNDKGKGPGSVKISILLVWVRNDQHAWQLLARQAVRV